VGSRPLHLLDRRPGRGCGPSSAIPFGRLRARSKRNDDDHEDHDHNGDDGDNVEAADEEESLHRLVGKIFAYCIADAYHAHFQPLLGQAVQDQRHDETLTRLFAVTYWLHYYHAAWLTNYKVATDLLASPFT
jgi:hypothetical protein